MRKKMADKQSSPRNERTYMWLVMMKVFHAMAAHARADLARNRLGLSDFAVLELLHHKGATPVSAIGPKVHLTPGSISTAVDRLHAKKLVSRTEDATDRRVRTVNLTSKGRALIVPVFARHAATMGAASRGLTVRECAELAALLKKLGKFAETLPC